jgi:transposase InsO family protein
MVAVPRREGVVINRKRVQRLMRVMGLEAIYQKPNTSQGHSDHKVYRYLLRGLTIDRANRVWCADITYIPMAKGLQHPRNYSSGQESGARRCRVRASNAKPSRNRSGS